MLWVSDVIRLLHGLYCVLVLDVKEDTGKSRTSHTIHSVVPWALYPRADCSAGLIIATLADKFQIGHPPLRWLSRRSNAAMEDEQLHSLLQTALLLTRCVNLPSQDAAQRLLHEHSSLHSIGSYAWQTSPPIKYLAAVTDGRAQLGADCKTALKLAPTLYLALGDYVPTAEPSADKKAQQHAVPGLALHYSALRGELPYPDLPQGTRHSLPYES